LARDEVAPFLPGGHDHRRVAAGFDRAALPHVAGGIGTQTLGDLSRRSIDTIGRRHGG
jgi:hypothetical protein